nr:RNA-directed DNA polymerase, eukaryota, reverse transcriptase zinc-binding domain protein [Tanacetum cinerariifolium]
QGFLNRSARVKNQMGDGTKKIGSILSRLAKRVKNIDGKVVGKDGKPMKDYRSVTFRENTKDTGRTTARVASGFNARDIDYVVEVGIPLKAAISHVNTPARVGSNQVKGDDRHGCDMTGALPKMVHLSKMNCDDVITGADVAIPMTVVQEGLLVSCGGYFCTMNIILSF